ncbi:MAG: hypothetical protein M1829_004527 [Trizodia sp. TS-e1964]|nr:MAG: hypothetical protein M1829_004527 [Trizodia sp. TS-e1964]
MRLLLCIGQLLLAGQSLALALPSPQIAPEPSPQVPQATTDANIAQVVPLAPAPVPQRESIEQKKAGSASISPSATPEPSGSAAVNGQTPAPTGDGPSATPTAGAASTGGTAPTGGATPSGGSMNPTPSQQGLTPTDQTPTADKPPVASQEPVPALVNGKAPPGYVAVEYGYYPCRTMTQQNSCASFSLAYTNADGVASTYSAPPTLAGCADLFLYDVMKKWLVEQMGGISVNQFCQVNCGCSPAPAAAPGGS